MNISQYFSIYANYVTAFPKLSGLVLIVFIMLNSYYFFGIEGMGLLDVSCVVFSGVSLLVFFKAAFLMSFHSFIYPASSEPSAFPLSLINAMAFTGAVLCAVYILGKSISDFPLSIPLAALAAFILASIFNWGGVLALRRMFSERR